MLSTEQLEKYWILIVFIIGIKSIVKLLKQLKYFIVLNAGTRN